MFFERVIGMETYQPKQFLVTGGSGFLGSHLCEKLLDFGNDVICLDNFFTGSKHNVRHLIGHPNFELVRHDVIDPLLVEVDGIFNLACPASPIHYQYDPVKTTKTSVLGVMNMLELARQTNAKVLQASTSEVYGDPEVHPQDEEYWGKVNPIGPRACYDEGKRCAETLCFDYARQYGLDVAVARIFNTYGPRMQPNDGRVVSNFIVQAIRGEDLTVFGTGQQTRSFCFVDDLIDGLMRLMMTDAEFTGPINLGNDTEYSMLELAEAVLSIVGGSSKIKFTDLPVDDPKQRRPDIEKAAGVLNWTPKVGLSDGLEKTVAYFQKRLDCK